MFCLVSLFACRLDERFIALESFFRKSPNIAWGARRRECARAVPAFELANESLSPADWQRGRSAFAVIIHKWYDEGQRPCEKGTTRTSEPPPPPQNYNNMDCNLSQRKRTAIPCTCVVLYCFQQAAVEMAFNRMMIEQSAIQLQILSLSLAFAALTREMFFDEVSLGIPVRTPIKEVDQDILI